MSRIHAEQLAASLEKNFVPIYLIHGEEVVLWLEAIDQIRQKAKKSGYTERTVIEVDNQFDDAILQQAICSQSLFSTYQLLEIYFTTGKLITKSSEILKKLAQDPPENTIVLLIFTKLDKLQQKSDWFNTLSKIALIVDAKPIPKDQFAEWIKKRFVRQRQVISEDALALMVEQFEGNCLAAKQTIDKFSLLNEYHEITLDNMKNHINHAAHFSVFELGDAWMGQDCKRTLRILNELKVAGEALTLILWVVTDDIRKLIKFRQAISTKQPLGEIEKNLRLWGNKKNLVRTASRRLNSHRLIFALIKCAQLDRQIKGLEEIDPWQSLQKMLITLAN
jgi:DNA polymerase-3 subunit delta